MKDDDDADALSALRRYLRETATAGVGPARAIGMFRLAQGVFCVIDRYAGQLEYDVYFHVDAAKLTPEQELGSRATNATLAALKFDCCGLGPMCRSVATAVQWARGALTLNGSAWPTDPDPVSLNEAN